MNSLEFHKNKNISVLTATKTKSTVDLYHILPIVKRNSKDNLEKYDKHVAKSEFATQNFYRPRRHFKLQTTS